MISELQGTNRLKRFAWRGVEHRAQRDFGPSENTVTSFQSIFLGSFLKTQQVWDRTQQISLLKLSLLSPYLFFCCSLSLSIRSLSLSISIRLPFPPLSLCLYCLYVCYLSMTPSTLYSLDSRRDLLAMTLTTQTPLFKRRRFTPLIKGVGCPKPLVLWCFLSPTPLIRGVDLQPLH